MTIIVGLTGPAGVGKDTAANVMVRELGFTRLALADPIKKAITILDPFLNKFGDRLTADLAAFESDGVIGSESYFRAWDYVKQMPEARRLLQVFGSEVGRDMFGENVWIDKMYRDAEGLPLVVVPDIRFHNEATFLKRHNGFVVSIRRPGVGPVNDHISDRGLPATLIDYTLPNDGDLRQFEELVLDCFRGLAAPGTSAT